MNCSFSVYFKAALCPLLASTSIIALLQNVIFCGIVWHDKTLHKRSLILIVNLSVSGILNALTVPVFEFIYVYYFPAWPLGRLGTNLQNSVWLFSLVLPFMTVMCITAERYLATVHNVFHRTNITASALGMVVFILWAYSLAWTVVLSTQFTPAADTYYIWNMPQELYYIFLGLHLVVPLLAITVFYQRIIVHTRSSKRDISLLGDCHENQQRQSSEVRLAKTVAMVIGCLYAVWVPVVMMEVVYNFDFSDCIVEQGGTSAVFVTSLNGCLYPLIYFYRIKEVRRNLNALRVEFVSILGGIGRRFCCCCRCWLNCLRHHGTSNTTERITTKNDRLFVDNDNYHPYTTVEDDEVVDEGGSSGRRCATPL